MAKITLSDVNNILGSPTSAQTTINNNSRLIEQAIENTLSRDGTTPNQMAADIDMNSNDLLNVGLLDTDRLILDGQELGNAQAPLFILDEVLEARDDAQDFALLSQAWAEGTQPGGPGTKSAREWAETAGSFFTDVQLTVPSLVALKALNTSQYKTAYLNSGERSGVFQWTAGDFSSLITSDTTEALYVKADAIASTSGAWVRKRNGLDIYVGWSGAVADSTGVGNGTDNITAFNAALSLAKLVGGNVYLGLGSYRLSSTWTYDKSAINSNSGRVPSIYGAGITLSRIYSDAGVSVGLDIVGAMTPGVFGSFFFIKDFSIFSSGKTGHGIRLTDVAFFDLQRVRVNGWDRGLNLRNVISSKIDRLFSDSNVYGAYLEDGPSNIPCNAVSLFNCWIGSNDRLGIYAHKVATLTVDGGSIEGNGLVTGGSDPNNSGGIFVLQPGEGGHNSTNLRGIYFEHNRGVADVLILSSTYATSHLISGCSFTRLSATEYTNYNVYLNAGTVRQTLTLSGNGFGKLSSGYVESAARPYINIDDPNNVVTFVEAGDNTYQSDVAKPNFSAVFGYTEKTHAQAVGWVSSAGALSAGSSNVASITKLATGRYKINLKRGWVGPKTVVATPNLPRIPAIFTYDDTSVTVSFYTTALAEGDVDFGFAVFKPVT